MPNPRIITVCLPDTEPTDTLATEAIRRYQSSPHAAGRATPLAHFATSSRRHSNRLVQPEGRTAAGGPLNMIDFAAMATAGQRVYWQRWHTWNQVVHGTRPAAPYWRFIERIQRDPRYTCDRARTDYLAQPRVAAMTQYNLLPNRVMELPTAHLEALQTSAQAYMHLGALATIHGHGLLTKTGVLLTPGTAGRLSDLHEFIAAAQRALRCLSRTDRLVALACN